MAIETQGQRDGDWAPRARQPRTSSAKRSGAGPTTYSIYRSLPDGGWSRTDPNPGPPQRTVQNLIYDGWQGSLLTYGAADGQGDSYLSDRVWRWDGTSWSIPVTTDAEGLGNPGRRVGFRWAFDERRGRAVLFGGTASDTWELEGATRRPGQQVEFALDLAQVPVGARFSELKLEAVAGGTGAQRLADAGWARVDGVEVLPWLDDAWGPPLSTNSAPDSAPGAVGGALTGASADRALAGARWTAVAIVPRGVAGANGASVNTDFLELSMRYRLP
jgi:hypothetical protein